MTLGILGRNGPGQRGGTGWIHLATGGGDQRNRISSKLVNHSHPLSDWGHAIRRKHHVPLCENGSLARNILFGDGHLLEEHSLGHHGTLASKRGLLLLDDFDVRVKVQSPIS